MLSNYLYLLHRKSLWEAQKWIVAETKSSELNGFSFRHLQGVLEVLSLPGRHDLVRKAAWEMHTGNHYLKIKV